MQTFFRLPCSSESSNNTQRHQRPEEGAHQTKTRRSSAKHLQENFLSCSSLKQKGRTGNALAERRNWRNLRFGCLRWILAYCVWWRLHQIWWRGHDQGPWCAWSNRGNFPKDFLVHVLVAATAVSWVYEGVLRRSLALCGHRRCTWTMIVVDFHHQMTPSCCVHC